MEIEYQKELDKIKKIIEKNPRGTTIKEIAKKIGVNRNVVAKYLDVLQMAGYVDVEKFGRSKVYFPSHSATISSMFDFSNEFLVVVKKDMTAVEINNPFVKYLGLANKNKVVGKNIKTLSFAKDHPKMTENILETLENQQVHEDDIEHKRNNSSKTDHLRAKFVPTRLNDGDQGVAVIISRFRKK